MIGYNIIGLRGCKLELVKKNIKLKIETKNYGTVTIYLNDEENKIGDGYFVTATKHGKKLAGFVDYTGKEIIPLQVMELKEEFHNKDYHDICFGFQMPNCNTLDYYHVKKQEDGKYRWVLKTCHSDIPALMIQQVKENDDFWLFKTVGGENEEYAIYSLEKGKFITNFFDVIDFNIGSNPYGHVAYFCKDITGIYDNEKVVYTSICGFFDKDGNFSSQILEVESGLLYNSYQLGNNSFSNSFRTFINALTTKYKSEYDEKDKSTQAIISHLFNGYNGSTPPKKEIEKKARIIKFPS